TGVDAYVAAQFNEPGNLGRGFRTYLRIGARAAFSYAPSHYTIVTGTERLTVRAILVVVANSSQYGNHALIARGVKVDDGLLDLVVVEERPRFLTVLRTPHLFRGTLGSVAGCSIRRVTSARIESNEPMTFHVDGEPVVDGMALEARIHPR